jgi:hypothetical protein
MKIGFYLMVTNFLLASPSLKSLRDADTIQIETLRARPTLGIIFQEDCHVCHKQVQDLACLGPDVQVVLLGAFSSEHSLLQEYRAMGVSFPAYYASRDILQSLQLNGTVTPQTIFFTPTKQWVTVGYKPCDELHKIGQQVFSQKKGG